MSFFGFNSYPASGQLLNKNTQFYDSNLGLSFQYPLGWTKIQLSSGIAFLSPRNTALFQVLALNLGPNTSLSNYINGFMNEVKGTLPGFNLMAPPVYTTADNPNGYRILYTFDSPTEGPIEVMVKFVQNGDKVYQVMYLSPIGNVHADIDEAMTMWTTMRIIGPIGIPALEPYLSSTTSSFPSSTSEFQPQTPNSLIGLDTIGSEEIIGNINSPDDQ